MDKLRADNDGLHRQIDTYANQIKEMAEMLEKLSYRNRARNR